tara:strand:- start:489 stop:611 length:123 start_codon:yes stop_codon:yes gene_type:complete
MDDANKAAAAVLVKDGPEAAAQHMLSEAGWSYSRMRSIYG